MLQCWMLDAGCWFVRQTGCFNQILPMAAAATQGSPSSFNSESASSSLSSESTLKMVTSVLLPFDKMQSVVHCHLIVVKRPPKTPVSQIRFNMSPYICSKYLLNESQNIWSQPPPRISALYFMLLHHQRRQTCKESSSFLLSAE